MGTRGIGRICSLCALLLAFGAATCDGAGKRASRPKVPPGTPRIRFAATSIDLGDVYHGDEATGKFTFSNAGTSTLTIQAVTSGCGCTVTLPEKRAIEPGEASEIRVGFDPAGLRGRFAKSLRVESNDPEHPTVELTFAGQVLVEVEASAIGVYGGKIAVGESTKRFVTLRGVAADHFKVLSTTSKDPAVRVTRVRVDASSDGRDGYLLEITFGPADAARLINTDITVATDLKHAKYLHLKAYGRVVARDRNGAAK